MKFEKHELEAEYIKPRKFCVKPKNQLGTCGWYPRPWTALFITAKNEKDAINKYLRFTSRKDIKV